MKVKKTKRRRKGLKTGLFLAFLGMSILIGGIYSLAHEALRQPVYLERPVMVDIRPGMRFLEIAYLLRVKRLWEHPYWVAVYAKLTGVDGRLKAGYYQFEGIVSPLEVLKVLIEGKVKVSQIALIEGQTLQQWLQQLRAVANLKKTIPTSNATEFLKQQLGVNSSNLEGWFFPATYQITPDTSDQDILLRAHQTMQRALADAWLERAPQLPYQSPYEALIMASIIEKETAQPTERARIGGVFLNRLRLDMKLQTDPTVIYGLGDAFEGNLTREHLKLATPYNTYLNKGLPPTPIAMVSMASLLAALHPESTDELYFVAKKDGFHAFSITLKEHNEAVRRYQLSKKSP